MNNYRMVEAEIWVYEGPPEEGKTPVKKICRFHGFSTDFLELEDGLASCPVAIVEAPDGSIHAPSAESVRFTTGLMDTDTRHEEPDPEVTDEDRRPCIFIDTEKIYLEPDDTLESINAKLEEFLKNRSVGFSTVSTNGVAESGARQFCKASVK